MTKWEVFLVAPCVQRGISACKGPRCCQEEREAGTRGPVLPGPSGPHGKEAPLLLSPQTVLPRVHLNGHSAFGWATPPDQAAKQQVTPGPACDL